MSDRSAHPAKAKHAHAIKPRLCHLRIAQFPGSGIPLEPSTYRIEPREDVPLPLPEIDRRAPAVVTIGGSPGEAHADAVATLPSRWMTHEKFLNAVHGSSQRFR